MAARSVALTESSPPSERSKSSVTSRISRSRSVAGWDVPKLGVRWADSLTVTVYG